MAPQKKWNKKPPKLQTPEEVANSGGPRRQPQHNRSPTITIINHSHQSNIFVYGQR